MAVLQEELDDYDGKNRRGKVAIVHILFRVKGDSDLVVSAKALIVQSLYNTIYTIYLVKYWHPIQGGVVLLVVASCYVKKDKLSWEST